MKLLSCLTVLFAGKTDACAQYRSYLFGDLNFGKELLVMVASMILYAAIILFLESSYWQKCWEAVATFYYKMRNPERDQGDGNGEKGFYKQLGTFPLQPPFSLSCDRLQITSRSWKRRTSKKFTAATRR